MDMFTKKPVREDIRQFIRTIHLQLVQFQCSGMLRKLGGMRDRDSVEDESGGGDAFQSTRMRRISDGYFEVGNGRVSGNFDWDNVLIWFSQDPAVNVEIGVRHGWESGVGS